MLVKAMPNETVLAKLLTSRRFRKVPEIKTWSNNVE
jgi:hypothetical protein